MSFDVPKEFGVPDQIRDMTRSLEMVETYNQKPKPGDAPEGILSFVFVYR